MTGRLSGRLRRVERALTQLDHGDGQRRDGREPERWLALVHAIEEGRFATVAPELGPAWSDFCAQAGRVLDREGGPPAGFLPKATEWHRHATWQMLHGSDPEIQARTLQLIQIVRRVVGG
jgi:hypothetical protein